MPTKDPVTGLNIPTEAERQAWQDSKTRARERHKFNGVVIDLFNEVSYPITATSPVIEQKLNVHYISGTIASAIRILPTEANTPESNALQAAQSRIYPTPKYDEGTRFDAIPQELQALDDPKYPDGPIPPAIKYYQFDHEANEWTYWLNVGPYQERQNVQVTGDHYDSSDEPILESTLDTYGPVSHEEILQRIKEGKRV